MPVLAQQSPSEMVALAHAQCHYRVSTNYLVGLGSQAGHLLPSRPLFRYEQIRLILKLSTKKFGTLADRNSGVTFIIRIESLESSFVSLF